MSITTREYNVVIQSSGRAFNGLFDRESRSVVLKSFGLTILLFFGVWFGMERLASTYLVPMIDGWAWLVTALVWSLSAGVIVTAGFFLAPVTALFAGLFLDEVAGQVEQDHYPRHLPGKSVSMGRSILLALKFGMIVIIANLVALALVWLAGFGVIVFFILNGYFLGREYFQFAAMRHRDEADAKILARKYGVEIFLSGLIISVFMSIPGLNFLSSIFLG